MAATRKYPFVLKWAKELINLFLPTVCGGCGALGPTICRNCYGKFAWVKDPICNRCGRALINPANVCGKCFSEKFILHQVRSPLFYREPVTTVIHQMKYAGLHALTKPLAKIMIDYWPNWDLYPQIIIPIPLHRKREKQRGFNQSALLANHIGKGLKIEIHLNTLIRVKNTLPQVGLPPQKRKENVRDAFQVRSKEVKEKHILLVDDVFTTGATMQAAGKTLLESGAASVSSYCLARTT